MLAASAFFSSGVNGGEGRLAQTPSKIKTSALVCSFSQKRSSSAKRVFMEARRSRLACFIRSRGVLSRLSFSSRRLSLGQRFRQFVRPPPRCRPAPTLCLLAQTGSSKEGDQNNRVLTPPCKVVYPAGNVSRPAPLRLIFHKTRVASRGVSFL